MINRGGRGKVFVALAAACALTLLASAASSSASATRVVRYHGLTIAVPASWPVYNLATDPTQCVRFDQHAVYLGTPGAVQDCPARVVGHTEAILVQPLDGATSAGLPTGGSARQYADRSAGVQITTTWLHDRATVDTALSSAGVDPSAGGPVATPPASTRATQSVATGQAWIGLGFDACSAPSTSQMAAWRSSSPYQTIGVYIGGANRGCSQPNLTSSWVSTVMGAGWKLLPLYVGLQAPNNACGCASMSSTTSTAASQGIAAANGAVADAEGIGIGAGAAIYDDMEGYTDGSPNTPAVLAFLGAWTQQLHSLGYYAGVYSSLGSGIGDLIAKYGTSYTEPDEIWWAEWNDVATTTCTCLSSSEWGSHQRLKQYWSPGNETYGGVTISIDEDDLNARVYGNPRPGCSNMNGSTTSGQPVTIHLRCHDAAGAKLTYSIFQRPAGGQLGAINQTTGTVTYTPNATGSDSFRYRASSVNGQSSPATVTITNS